MIFPRCITELVEQWYQPPGASTHSHLPADVHHVARFAAQPLEGSRKGAGEQQLAAGRLSCCGHAALCSHVCTFA